LIVDNGLSLYVTVGVPSRRIGDNRAYQARRNQFIQCGPVSDPFTSFPL